MTTTPRWWPGIRSIGLWWALLTLALWLLSRAVDQPTGLIPCAASAALLVTVGETGNWLRRQWRKPPGPRS
ncbi:hypothetical protein [Streptomyces sp. NPDC002133]|uniref:hypothetical protein n=1 Tax=Streptomyces sp. NPDC002133 TaxID=3154409 RepID=UPI00331B769B